MSHPAACGCGSEHRAGGPPEVAQNLRRDPLAQKTGDPRQQYGSVAVESSDIRHRDSVSGRSIVPGLKVDLEPGRKHSACLSRSNPMGASLGTGWALAPHPTVRRRIRPRRPFRLQFLPLDIGMDDLPDQGSAQILLVADRGSRSLLNWCLRLRHCTPCASVPSQR